MAAGFRLAGDGSAVGTLRATLLTVPDDGHWCEECGIPTASVAKAALELGGRPWQVVTVTACACGWELVE